VLYFLLVGQDPSLFFFFGLICLLLGKVIDKEQALHGFANTSLLAIMTLMLLGKAIENCHILDYVIDKILGRNNNIYIFYLKILPLTAFTSAFINNTPVVAILLPILQIWSSKNNIPLTKLAMPVSFAAILGGTCTLIGSSAMMLADGLLLEIDPDGRIDFWQPAPIGILLTIVGILYLMSNKWLLPQTSEYQPCLTRSYVVVKVVNTDKLNVNDFVGVKVIFASKVTYDEGHRENIQTDADNYWRGDYLTVIGINECLHKLYQQQDKYGVEFIKSTDLTFNGLQNNIYQGVNVDNYQKRIGQNIHLLIRNGQEIDLDEYSSIHDGFIHNNDVIIFSADHKPSPLQYQDLQLLSYWIPIPQLNNKIFVSSIILISLLVMVVLSSLNVIDLYILVTFVLIIFMLLQLSTWQDVIQQTNWSVYLLLSSSIGLGKAIKISGLIEEIADIVEPIIGGWNIIIILFMLSIITTLLSSLIATPGVISIMIPIAHTFKNRYQIESSVFYVVIMYACSCQFLTYFSFQTNLLVQSVTGYRSIDYIKYGTFLTILTTIISVIGSYILFYIIW